MALLAFEEADIAGSPAGELFSTSHRQKTANRVNSAILTSQCQEKGLLSFEKTIARAFF